MAQRAPKDNDAKARILARLRSAEGHMRAVVGMVESDAYCIDVLQQTTAIHSALVKVEGLLIERHLHHCVSNALGSKDRSKRERALGELIEIFEASRK